MAESRSDPGSLPSRAAATRLDAEPEDWRVWFRADFLRSCFLWGSLAWDALSAVQIRDLLDPWHPGQGWSPPYVYGVIVLFVALSTVGQVLLYRRLWPHPARSAWALGFVAWLRGVWRRVRRRR